VVVLTALFPGSALHMQASPWLPLHWALGVASYGLIAAAVVHAWLMMRAEKSMRQGADAHVGLPLLTLERLTFRFVNAGFVLLTATLAAGWLFGDSLYGAQAAWRWDHKTVFSLLAWFTFVLLLGYAGSRFVLEVVLGRVA
jgi:ABC-type uncharacterized transport system permease subunit